MTATNTNQLAHRLARDVAKDCTDSELAKLSRAARPGTPLREAVRDEIECRFVHAHRYPKEP